MKSYLTLIAAVALIALPNCGGSSCCKKECKKEESCQTQPEEQKRESGPLADKEVGFSESDKN